VCVCGVCVVCVCGVCLCMCGVCVCVWCVCGVSVHVCVCVCACLSVRLFRNHELSRKEKFHTLSVGDAYLIIMLSQILPRPTL